LEVARRRFPAQLSNNTPPLSVEYHVSPSQIVVVVVVVVAGFGSHHMSMLVVAVSVVSGHEELLESVALVPFVPFVLPPDVLVHPL